MLMVSIVYFFMLELLLCENHGRFEYAMEFALFHRHVNKLLINVSSNSSVFVIVCSLTWILSLPLDAAISG